ncbi:MAG: ABC transporter permease [Candidatus Bipolaricaulota bacterium]
MSRSVSRGAIVAALTKRELRAYSRDKLYLFLTGLTLVFVVGIFWIAPGEVDEELTLAISPPLGTLLAEGAEALGEMGVPEEELGQLAAAAGPWEEEGLRIVEMESQADLLAVLHGELEAWRREDGTAVLREREATDAPPAGAERVHLEMGIAFPAGFVADLASGAVEAAVTVYSHATVPAEIRGALRSFVREAAYQLSGRELPVRLPDEETIVLGPDRAGDQIPLREKLIPMIAFMILLLETFSLGSLISTEVLQRTVTAVLVTPARVGDFLLSKTLFGTGLALGQGVLVLALVGAFTGHNWLVLLVTILIGALMFTGVAMVVGAAGKDFIGQLFYSMLITVPLMIPAFTVLFPGSTAAWVRVIPTYPVLDALLGATVYGASWGALWPSFAIGAGWCVALYGAGLLALRRKVVSL